MDFHAKSRVYRFVNLNLGGQWWHCNFKKNHSDDIPFRAEPPAEWLWTRITFIWLYICSLVEAWWRRIVKQYMLESRVICRCPHPPTPACPQVWPWLLTRGSGFNTDSWPSTWLVVTFTVWEQRSKRDCPESQVDALLTMGTWQKSDGTTPPHCYSQGNRVQTQAEGKHLPLEG